MQLLKDTNFDFINKYRTGFLFSAVLIIFGIVFLIVHGGPNFGIDFRGGVKVEAKFNRVVTEAELKTKLTELGYEDAKIQLEPDENKAYISMGHRPEFQQQSINIPIIADPGDATATSLQVSSTSEKVHLLNSGDTVELIDGDLQRRNEISARELVAEGTAISTDFYTRNLVWISQKTLPFKYKQALEVSLRKLYLKAVMVGKLSLKG